MEKVRADSSHTAPWRRVAQALVAPKPKSRRKYVFTDQMDQHQLIPEIYLSHRDAKSRPDIRLLAKKVGMPYWTLKRARELGLARTKELLWSEKETGDPGSECVDER